MSLIVEMGASKLKVTEHGIFPPTTALCSEPDSQVYPCPGAPHDLVRGQNPLIKPVNMSQLA
jgi:hypothetical protein